MVPVSGDVVGEKNIYVTITNSCSIPIHVVHLGITMEDGIEGFCVCNILPKVLHESEYTIEKINIKSLPDVKKGNYIKNIYAFDVLKNKWHVKNKELEKINLEIDKIINN
ncbi:hypothetical protein AB840_04095 [Megasphaera cerevisiae DSM 20462]|uniref:Uncharacterized protein n=2 Tax=Megasphaera TaxID=906 RepID=A0A0J6ZQI2_9FIRM|nr:hypothetical protein [Megasphaera cerevisiae]KMO87216.1 hypothetical protein AB840_04095 [Megasphaera cerevisiae DSM 20462]SJZ60823.1 hypothetical protein SAMN05660900_00950 [Megasphaera cerevisiae DSM 20462]